MPLYGRRKPSQSFRCKGMEAAFLNASELVIVQKPLGLNLLVAPIASV